MTPDVPARLLGQNLGGLCPNASAPVQELDGNVLPLSAWLADATKHGRRRRWDLLGKEKILFTQLQQFPAP